MANQKKSNDLNILHIQRKNSFFNHKKESQKLFKQKVDLNRACWEFWPLERAYVTKSTLPCT